jgi:choline kinase
VQHSADPPARAVILVAGIGSRLGERTAELPKCLVEVAGVPIVQNAVERLETVGIQEAILVTGYREEAVRERLGTRFGRMRISYRSNHAYRRTNTSCSLFLGLQDVEDDVVVLEGDVFFEQRVLDEALHLPHSNVTVVERWNPALDGSVVELDSSCHVRRWVHKKDRPPGFSLDGTFKTVNLHRLSRGFVIERLRPVLDEMMRDGGREPLETVFARVVDAGGRIFATQAAGRWVEIDDESDLRVAEALFPGGPNEHR